MKSTQASLDDAEKAKLQRRILELEAKVEEQKRALRSAYRANVAIQAAVDAAEVNIFNWQEELRDE